MSSQIVTLVDPASGGTARVLPELGFNCFSFCPLLDGEPVEMLWAAPGFESGTLRSTASGTPILFPFAGRLSGTSLRFGDREVPLVIDPRQGCAIHGFVHNRPWRVLSQKPASVTGEFHAAQDDAKLLDLWPADFRIRVCYELSDKHLHCQITVDNPSDRPLPFSLGTHGYFRVPLSGDLARSEAARDGCRVFVPARRYWELSKMMPTGQTLPADGHYALAAGMPFSETKLDDVLTDLESRDGRVACRIDDPTNGRQLVLKFDDSFRECVVFNPPHREAICLEPYTAAPDAFALAERGIAAGLRVLQPGEAFQARIDIRVGTYG